MMSGLIFGGVLIVGGVAWWLSNSFVSIHAPV